MIVLFNPPVSIKAPFPGKVQSGLACLAHYLSYHGIKVHIIDCDSIDECISEFEDIRDKIRFAGITGLSYQIKNGLVILKKIKDRFPEIVTLAGGPACTGLGHRLIEENSFLDLVIVSEGEKALLRICEGVDYSLIDSIIYRGKDGNTIQNRKPDLLSEHELFLPDRKFYRNNGIFYDQALKSDCMLLILSRGCTGRCGFCLAHKIFPGRVRYVSLDKVEKYLKNIIETSGVRSFVIDDDNFLSSTDYASGFAHIAEKLGIRFRINMSQDYFDEKVMLCLKRSGLIKISVGVESIFEDTQRFIRKRSDLEKIRNICDFCRINDIQISLLFIAALPFETSERLIKTIDIIKEISPSGGFDFQVFQPHPGTYSENDLSVHGNVISHDLDDYFSDNMIFIPNGISFNEVRDILWKHTGKTIRSPLEKEKSFLEIFGNFPDCVFIDPEKYQCMSKPEASNWKGSQRCMSGLGMIKVLDKAFLRYFFEFPGKSDSDYLLVIRIASHVEGFPEGKQYSSDIEILINGNIVKAFNIPSIHTTGTLYCIQVSGEYLVSGKNLLDLRVTEENGLCNGLSVFTYALNDFYKVFETGIFLIPYSDMILGKILNANAVFFRKI